MHKEKDEALQERCENVGNSLSSKTRRAADLAKEKGVSSWLTVIPRKNVDFTLNKSQFRDAVHLSYDSQNNDIPLVYFCWVKFSADHAMICRQGGFIIQRHIELRDLEAELMNVVSSILC